MTHIFDPVNVLDKFHIVSLFCFLLIDTVLLGNMMINLETKLATSLGNITDRFRVKERVGE